MPYSRIKHDPRGLDPADQLHQNQLIQHHLIELANEFGCAIHPQDLALGRIEIEDIEIFLMPNTESGYMQLALHSHVILLDGPAVQKVSQVMASQIESSIEFQIHQNQLNCHYLIGNTDPWKLSVDALSIHLFYVFEQVSHWRKLLKLAQTGEISYRDLHFSSLCLDVADLH